MPSRTRLTARAFGVEEQLPVDDVAEVSLQGPDGVLLGLALGQLAFEVGPPVGAAMTDLADGGHVQCVVEATVAPPRGAVHDPRAGGSFDGGGAVVGGVWSRFANRVMSPVKPIR